MTMEKMEPLQLSLPPAKRLVKTALHQAVLDGRLHQVRLLVDRHGVRVDPKDMHGRTPLMLACMLDNEERAFKMAAILLKAGAYLSARDSLGRTAISYASLNGREAIVNSILKEDILDINEPDNDGNTPLHHAAIGGSSAIVRMLAETFNKFGLSADNRNKLGYTPLLLACKNGNYVSAYTLLTLTKASPALRDNEFRLSAREWIQKSHHRQKHFVERSFLSSAPTSLPPPHTLSFSREYTMYQPCVTPPCQQPVTPRAAQLCRTARPTLKPLGPSTGSSLDEESGLRDVFIEKSNARQMLLELIEEFENKQSQVTGKTSRGRFSHPPTAKLLALSRRGRRGVPHDMVTLFKIYSDQYYPDDWCSPRNNARLAREEWLPSQSGPTANKVDKDIHTTATF